VKLGRTIAGQQNLVRFFATSNKFGKGAFGTESNIGSIFSFPRHKELFNEDFYQGEPDPNDDGFTDMVKSPYLKRLEQMDQKNVKDAMDFGPNGQQLDFSVEGGILSNYRKQTGQTVEDMLEGDYWHAMRDVGLKAADHFNIVSKNEKDMMNNTKNMTMRLRLNREIDYTEDFRKKHLIKDYGNYEKYEKNSVNLEYDEGVDETTHDKIYANFMDMLKRLPVKDRQ